MTSGIRGTSMLILLLVASCTGSEEVNEAEVMTDPEGYTVAIPSGWDVSENFRNDAYIRADITRGDDMGIQIRLTDVSPNSYTSTAEAMITDYVDDMSSHRGGPCLETGREVITAGEEALTARFQSQWEDGQ